MSSESQPQQSWAAWLIDAYASAVATEPCEDTDSSYDSMSPAISDAGKNDSTSPYGPYVRTGRGGAGNFQWQSQQRSDPEAQRPMGLKEKRKAAMAIESIDTSAAIRNAQARSSSSHARIGRGGAGNYTTYHQSNQPQNSPTIGTFPSTPISASSPTIYAGRGGAGNLGAARSVSNLAKLAKEREEQAEAERRRVKAEMEVGSMLQAPSQAYYGGRRRSTLPEDFEKSGYI